MHEKVLRLERRKGEMYEQMEEGHVVCWRFLFWKKSVKSCAEGVEEARGRGRFEE